MEAQEEKLRILQKPESAISMEKLLLDCQVRRGSILPTRCLGHTVPTPVLRKRNKLLQFPCALSDALLSDRDLTERFMVSERCLSLYSQKPRMGLPTTCPGSMGLLIRVWCMAVLTFL